MSETLADEFLQVLAQRQETYMSDTEVKKHFGDRYTAELSAVINDLNNNHRIKIGQLATTGEPAFSLVDTQLTAKMRNISKEAMMVFEVIERAGNRGIWTADIRKQLQLQQNQLTKILKDLQNSRTLIKSVTSVNARRKKLYMLYDLEPAKEITGGPWYTDNEFDEEFLRVLNMDTMNFIHRNSKATLKDIENHHKESSYSNVQLGEGEVRQLVTALIYDNKLEEVRIGLKRPHEASQPVYYKVASAVEVPQYWTKMPCGRCQVRDQCYVGGDINPESCEYMREWLARPNNMCADELP